MTSSPSRHTRRRRALSGAPRLTGDQLTAAQVALLEARIQETPSGCWEWTGSLDSSGYGQVVWQTRKYRPHRLLFEARAGAPLAEGLEVDHLCECRRCVNPSHLQAVSHAENLRRIRARDAAPLPFAWRAARDAALNLSHISSIQKEREI